MTAAAYIAMAIWVLFMVGAFLLFEIRRAILASLFAGWLFLPWPQGGFFDVPLLHSRLEIVCGALAGATILFGFRRWTSFRFRLVDLPMIVWCASAGFSSLANGLGLYDAASAFAYNLFVWGAPYWIGRHLFGDLKGTRDVALAIVAGGLIYAPLCLWEIRMSPQLHAVLYGYHQHSFAQTFRFGGWRPMVFMQHGLMVGLWMTAATLIGAWLWRSGTTRTMFRVPIAPLVLVLAVTTLLCKSTGALLLCGVGLISFFLLRRFGTALPIVCLLLASPAYIVFRLSGWTGEMLVSSVSSTDESRAQSLQFRLRNEDLLVRKAMQRKWLGWSRWGRGRIYDRGGHDISVTDGLWIIVFGEQGFIGLGSLLAAMLLPIFRLLRRHPARLWTRADLAPAAAIATVVGIYMVDNLLNAMVNPIFALAAGSLVAIDRAGTSIRQGTATELAETTPLRLHERLA